MSKKLTVIPEQCSGCRICELVCAIKHFGVNNPKKAAIRVLTTYPHPVVRMPIVCSQCKVPACAQVCPSDSLRWLDGVVQLDEENCTSCYKCVEACPFGAIYIYTQIMTCLSSAICVEETRSASRNVPREHSCSYRRLPWANPGVSTTS